jgi:hypothetical protein
VEWSTQANTHTQPSARVQAMVASVPQRTFGAAVNRPGIPGGSDS